MEPLACIRFVFSGPTYKGFILTGEFLVLDKSRLLELVETLELNKAIKDLDAHGNAKRELAELCPWWS